MTEVTEYSAYVSSLISLGLLIVLVFMHKDYQLDRYRQRLFDLRADLFDHAREGGIGFDDDAYRMTRELINCHIRFAHRTTFFHVLVYVRLGKKLANARGFSFHSQLDGELSKLAPEEKAFLEQSIRRLHVLFVDHVIRHSILLRALIIPVFILFIIGDLTMLFVRLSLRAIAALSISITEIPRIILQLAWKPIIDTARMLALMVAIYRRILVEPVAASRRKINQIATNHFDSNVDQIDEAALAI